MPRKRTTRSYSKLSDYDHACLTVGMGCSHWPAEETERLRALWMIHGRRLIEEGGRMMMGLHLFGEPPE